MALFISQRDDRAEPKGNRDQAIVQQHSHDPILLGILIPQAGGPDPRRGGRLPCSTPALVGPLSSDRWLLLALEIPAVLVHTCAMVYSLLRFYNRLRETPCHSMPKARLPIPTRRKGGYGTRLIPPSAIAANRKLPARMLVGCTWRGIHADRWNALSAGDAPCGEPAGPPCSFFCNA